MAAPDGYEELVRDQTPSLFRRALLLCHDWHLAEDLVQETAVTALVKWKKVSAAQDPAAYLGRILTNDFLSRTRRRSFSEAPTEIEIPGSVDPWADLDQSMDIAAQLAVLKPDERAVIVGRYVDDQPASVVAKDLGKTESWVRVTAHRALAKLQINTESSDKSATPKRTPTRRVKTTEGALA